MQQRESLLKLARVFVAKLQTAVAKTRARVAAETLQAFLRAAVARKQRMQMVKAAIIVQVQHRTGIG